MRRNWEDIRNIYITTTDPFYSERQEKMVPFSYRNLEIELGIPRPTIHVRSTTPNEKGETWVDERNKYFDVVREGVQERLSKLQINKDVKKKELVDSTEKMMAKINHQITAFFDRYSKLIDDEGNDNPLPFDSTEIISLIKAFETMKKNYAQLIDLIDTGKKTIIFNINVPVSKEYLTDAGIEYITGIRNDPKKIIDAECEVE